MFCPRCGASLWDGDRFCQTCGTAVPAAETPAPPEPVPVVEAEPAAAPSEPAAPVTAPAPPKTAFVPGWDQAFSTLELWRKLLGPAAPPLAALAAVTPGRTRRRPLLTGLALAACLLLLTAASALLIRWLVFAVLFAGYWG